MKKIITVTQNIDSYTRYKPAAQLALFLGPPSRPCIIGEIRVIRVIKVVRVIRARGN